MENNFDKFVKQSLEEFEVEYNPNHWKRIEQQLDHKARNGKFIFGGIMAAAVIATAVYFMQDENGSVHKQVAKVFKEQTPAPANTAPVKEEEIKTPEQKTAAPQEIKKENKTGIVSKAEPVADIQTEHQEKPELTANNNNNAPAPVKKPVAKDINALINVSRTQGCVAEPFYFSSEVNVPATYQWNFGDGSTSNLPSPAHAYSQAGKYSVSLKVTSLLDGRTLRTQEGGLVIVNPKPYARFNWNVDEEANFARKVEFNNQSRNTTYAQWIIDGKSYQDENLSVKFNRKGVYKSSLIVKNELGCYDTLTQNIVLDKDYNLLAPNAFTPNDDNQNDDFLPAVLRNREVDFRMDIVDPKNGNTIFSSNKRAWNGINQTTGAKADEGTYMWIITITKTDNSKESFKGNVSLLR